MSPSTSDEPQYDPADIIPLGPPILRGETDMVKGSRYISGSGNNKDTSFYRRLGENVLDVAINMDSGLKVMKIG